MPAPTCSTSSTAPSLGLTYRASEDRIDTGHFHRGKFILDRCDPAGEPTLN
jgi:hypothetical protein